MFITYIYIFIANLGDTPMNLPTDEPTKNQRSDFSIGPTVYLSPNRRKTGGKMALLKDGWF